MKKYYDLKPLLDTKCNWLILYGMRSNGKSYAVKKHIITQAYKKGEKFVYLRRWKEDIKTKDVQSYFEDMPVNEFTSAEWDGVMPYQGFFYFYKEDAETGKPIRSNKPIGRYCALNERER